LIEKPSHAVPDFSGEGQAQKDWLDVGPTSVERCSPVAMAQTWIDSASAEWRWIQALRDFQPRLNRICVCRRSCAWAWRRRRTRLSTRRWTWIMPRLRAKV